MATYYIAPAADGGDNAHDGSMASPWLTLAYAATQVTTAGDTIFVNEGTYTETARCTLALGVNILGDTAGIRPLINFTYAVNDFDNGCIRLYSSTLENAANQSISYINITGSNFTAYNAITVYNRGNVIIHHCGISNFIANGVVYSGPTAILTTPAEDNELYDCSLVDCSKRASGTGYGSIMIRGQKGLIIHDNLLQNTMRPAGSNGNLVNAVRGGYEGLKFYNNACYKPNYDDGEWNFHMEMWSSKGGCEIYDNDFIGGECAIDIASAASETAGHFKNAYDYSWYIHDNYFENGQKQSAPETDNNRFHITIEDCNAKDIWITRNYFDQTPSPISIEMSTNDFGPYENIHIYYNIFDDIGYANNTFASCLYIKSYGTNAVYENITFQNNVVMSGPTGKAVAAVRFYLAGTVNGINISNNIILNSYTAWLLTGNNGTEGVINDLVVRNNILYGNANSNAISDTAGMIDSGTYITSGNIIDNPDFVSATDFHLTSVSPAIAAGYDLNLALDYDQEAVHATTPAIGAYEYIAESILVTGITVSGAGSATTITVDNGTLQMSAAILPTDATNKNVVWSITAGTGTGNISATGLVTAVTDGTVTVRATATDGSGIYDDQVLTFSNQVNYFLVTGITVQGAGGGTSITTDDGTLQMVAIITPSNATNQAVTWSRTNGTGTATINSTGLVTALTDGSVTIRATAQDGSGVYDDQVITITNQIIYVTSITVTGAGGATTIAVDDGTLQMTATVLPADATNDTIVWSVTNGTGTASISTGGLLTALTNGTVTVRATATDGTLIFGVLLITITNQSGTRQIAPAGWHVPTWSEMEDLRIALDPDNITDPADNIAGGKMKLTGLTYWDTPNTSATNSSEWNGKGTGFRASNGTFSGIKEIAYYWNTLDVDSNGGIGSLAYDSAAFTTAQNIQLPKKSGAHVRLIKDDSNDPGTLTDYDGNVYATVKIGTQVWMAEDLRVTHYTDGTAIPLTTDGTDWAALTTAGRCYYNNDIVQVVINSIGYIGQQVAGALFNPQPSFVATSPEDTTITVYWEIRDVAHAMIASGDEEIAITTGTDTYLFSGVYAPVNIGFGFDFRVGKVSPPTLVSNHYEITT